MYWPDFFTVAPHGAGTQSFLFYLLKVGLPCSPWTAIDTAENTWEAMKFVNVHKRRYKCVGVTVDRNCVNPNLFPGLAGKKVPVFWIVRDPLAVLASNVNISVGNGIINAVMGTAMGADAPVDARAARPDLKTWFSCFAFAMPGFIFLFGSQLKSVLPYTEESRIELFDTSELTEAGAANVLGRIRKHCNGYYGESVRKLFSIPYNSFLNRAQCSVPLCKVGSGERSVTVWFCPKELYPFYTMYRKVTELGYLLVDGTEYTLFSPEVEPECVPGIRQELSSVYGELMERARVFRQKMETIGALYARLSFKPQDIVDFLMENGDYLNKFRSLLDGEFTMVERLRPGLAASWRYTAQCL